MKAATVPKSGDEPPEIGGLFADGAFHARLARARIARERVLAEDAKSGETDLLLPRRKPWDRRDTDTALSPRNSRKAGATSSIARPKVPLLVLDRAARIEPRPVEPAARRVRERPAAAKPAQVRTPTVPVVAPPQETSRRPYRILVAGGFAAGLLIGIAVSLTLVNLLPRTPERVTSAASDRLTAGAALPVLQPLDAAEADSAPAVQGLRPPRPPRPAIGGGLALLSAGLLPDAGQASPPGWADPAVAAALPDRQMFPKSPGADMAPGVQPPPPPFDATLSDVGRGAGTPMAQFPHRVVLHVPVSVTDDRLGDVTARLGAAGFTGDDPRRTGLSISESNVRYFHAEDADAAAVLADAIGAQARDFTNFSPAPPKGLIEIWLAGRGGQGAAPAQRTVSKPQATPAQVERDRRLLYLRSLILRQLRKDGYL